MFLAVIGSCSVFLWMTNRFVDGRPRILRFAQIGIMQVGAWFLANYLGGIPPI